MPRDSLDKIITYLKSLEIVDDPNIVPAGYDEDIIREGLGVVKGTIVPLYKFE